MVRTDNIRKETTIRVALGAEDILAFVRKLNKNIPTDAKAEVTCDDGSSSVWAIGEPNKEGEAGDEAIIVVTFQTVEE